MYRGNGAVKTRSAQYTVDSGERPRLAVAAMLLVLVAAGCHPGPRSDTAALAGHVVIDGEPVERGGVQFMPLERGQPAFSEVRGGAYTALVPKGRVRVIFSAVRETGREVQVYSSRVPEVVNALPPELADGVEITVDGDDRAMDFVLSSKGN